jgi:hypothetical protein
MREPHQHRQPAARERRHQHERAVNEEQPDIGSHALEIFQNAVECESENWDVSNSLPGLSREEAKVAKAKTVFPKNLRPLRPFAGRPSQRPLTNHRSTWLERSLTVAASEKQSAAKLEFDQLFDYITNIANRA